MLALAGVAACNTGNENKEKKAPVNDLGGMTLVASRFSDSVVRLQQEQGQCSDVEKMFSFDSIIAARKIEATALMYSSFDSLAKPLTLLFEQKANTDRITIKDLRVVGTAFNELELEARVDALDNSAYATPFASITVYDALGNRLDVAGGIGIESKLTAGQNYVFVGKIQNVQHLSPGFKIVFDEEMTKW